MGKIPIPNISSSRNSHRTSISCLIDSKNFSYKRVGIRDQLSYQNQHLYQHQRQHLHCNGAGSSFPNILNSHTALCALTIRNTLHMATTAAA